MPSEKSGLKDDLKLTLIILFCGAVNSVNIAKLAPSIPALQQHFDLGLAAIGLLASVFSILTIALGVLVGGGVRAAGAKRVLLGGLAAAALGNIVTLAGDAAPSLFIGRIIEGFGLVAVILTAPSLLAQHTSPGRRGLVMGLWSGFMPLGNALAFLCAPFLLRQNGWPGVWQGGLALSVLVIIAAFAMIPPDPPNPSSGGRRFDTSAVRLAMRTPILVVVGFCFAAHSMIYQSLLQFIPILSQTEAGLSIVGGTFLGALFCVINFAGNVTSGRLLQKGWTPKTIIRTVYILAAVLILCVLLVLREAPLLFGFLILTGFVTGGPAAVFFYVVSRSSDDPQNIPVFVAWVFQIQGLGMLTGPAVVGWIVETSGQWAYGLASLIPVCLAAALCAPLLRLKPPSAASP